MTYDESMDAVMRVARNQGFHPIVPLGTEDFLRSLVATYQGRTEDFEGWFLKVTEKEYRSFGEKPRWLQDPEWPILKGRPLAFVGQIDKHFPTNRTSFYVFWDQGGTGATRVIVQVLG